MFIQSFKFTFLIIFLTSFATSSYLENRCSRGDSKACETLGVMYITGDGVKIDGYKAIYYLDKSCKRGMASACNNIAFIYANAEGGVSENYTHAMHYWSKACRLGDSSGCANYQLAQDKLKALREGRAY